MLAKVPELNLNDYLRGSSPLKQKFIQELYAGLRQFGFIILNDHTLDEDLLAHAYELSEKLFSLPENKKKSYISPSGAGQRGYTPFGTEHAKDSAYADLKEFWHIGREFAHDLNSYPPNIWPEELHDFKPVFVKIYETLDHIGRILLQALTQPLQLELNYFDKIVNRGNSILRLLHYPPIPPNTDPNCVRAAAHEDINLITLLVSASSSGLELKDHDGHWIPIETSAHNIIVDSGDMLARITNDIIPATTHRVVNPKGPNTSRYSMPFFLHPNNEALLSCLPSCRGEKEKYAPILAGDFLQQRLKEIGLYEKK